MQIRLPQDKASALLSRAQSVLERKSTRPILENILLEADAGWLRVSSTDLRVSLVQRADCAVDRPGSIALQGRKIFEILREMPKGEVTLALKENGWVTASSGRSVFHLPGTPAEEYPSLPAEPSSYLSLAADTFRQMLEKTLFAASSDETRMYLCGVFVKSWEEDGSPCLRMVATDGHRLGLVDRPVGSEVGLFANGVIVPRKGLTELRGLLDGVEGSFDVATHQGRLFARVGTTILSITLIDAPFPNYQQVIPTDAGHTIRVPRVSLIDALRRVALVSDQDTHTVVLETTETGIVLTSTNPQLGDAREELEGEAERAGVRLAFNATYFVEGLRAFDGEEIVISLGDSLSPCVLRSATDPRALGVIMPMRVD